MLLRLGNGRHRPGTMLKVAIAGGWTRGLLLPGRTVTLPARGTVVVVEPVAGGAVLAVALPALVSMGAIGLLAAGLVRPIRLGPESALGGTGVVGALVVPAALIGIVTLALVLMGCILIIWHSFFPFYS